METIIKEVELELLITNNSPDPEIYGLFSTFKDLKCRVDNGDVIILPLQIW